MLEKKKKYPSYPKYFEIQTSSFCNAFCIICPYGEVFSGVPSGVMEWKLFENIIEQIKRKKQKKIRIIPYLNNEPFLDIYFVDRLRYIESRCPHAEIEISTNLSRLDEVKQKELSQSHIKELRLSVFGFTKRTYEQIMTELKWEETKHNLDILCSNKKLKSKVGIISLVMIDFPGISKKDINLAREYCCDQSIKFEFWGFLDRAGNVSFYSNKFYRSNIRGCEQNRALERIHILFDGKVIFCCMDWKREYIIGDLTEQTIDEIWNSENCIKMKQKKYGGNNRIPALCNKCKLSL